VEGDFAFDGGDHPARRVPRVGIFWFEISWDAYVEAKKASHLKQVRLVRESLLRRGDARDERPKRR